MPDPPREGQLICILFLSMRQSGNINDVIVHMTRTLASLEVLEIGHKGCAAVQHLILAAGLQTAPGRAVSKKLATWEAHHTLARLACDGAQ